MNWTEILRRAGLESPGYHEAVERTVTQWQRKQELKRMPKPRRSGGQSKRKGKGGKR